MQAGRTAEGRIPAITEGERRDNNKNRKRGTSHKRVAAWKNTTRVKVKRQEKKGRGWKETENVYA